MERKFDFNAFKEGLKALVAKFAKQKFASIKTADGKVLCYEGDTPQIGMPVMICGEGGAMSPAPDGEHNMEDGSVMIVKEGKILDIKKETPTNKPEEMTADQISEMISKVVTEKMTAITNDFAKQIGDLKTAFEAKFSEKDAAVATTNAAMKTVEEKLDKEMAFSKEVMTLLEKIPDGEVKKPKDKSHKKDEDPEKELREWRKKYMNQ